MSHVTIVIIDKGKNFPRSSLTLLALRLILTDFVRRVLRSSIRSDEFFRFGASDFLQSSATSRLIPRGKQFQCCPF